MQIYWQGWISELPLWREKIGVRGFVGIKNCYYCNLDSSEVKDIPNSPITMPEFSVTPLSKEKFEDFLIKKYNFFTLLRDVLRALEAKSFSCAYITSFCIVDHLTYFVNDGESTGKLFAKFLRDYFSQFTEKYTDEIICDAVWACRCSLIHTFGQSKISKTQRIVPSLTYNLDPEFHLHFDSQKRFQMSLPIFISEIIIVAEKVFEENIYLEFEKYQSLLAKNFDISTMEDFNFRQQIRRDHKIEWRVLHPLLNTLSDNENLKIKFRMLCNSIYRITE